MTLRGVTRAAIWAEGVTRGGGAARERPMLVRRRITAFFSIGLLAAAFAACVGQGANERCDATRGGDGDCTSPLVCVRGSLLGQNADVCCDPDPTQRAAGTICAGKGTTGGDAATDTATDTATSDTGSATDAADTATSDTGSATDAADTATSDTGSASDTATSDAADASDAG